MIEYEVTFQSGNYGGGQCCNPCVDSMDKVIVGRENNNKGDLPLIDQAQLCEICEHFITLHTNHWHKISSIFGKPYIAKFNLFGKGQGVLKNEMLTLELSFFPLLLFREPIIVSTNVKEYS